jgi:predicted O-methyltransferase YrrM
MKQLTELAIANKAQQKPYEFQKLLEMLDVMTSKKIAVEIGSYDGGCLYAYREMFGKTISIDLNQRSNIEGIDYIIGDSKTLYNDLKSKLGGKNTKIDFLMIDGDHSFEGVKSDFEIYHKLVKKGGIIAFHDVKETQMHTELNCFVSDFWNKIRLDERFEAIEFLDSVNDWGGIGVLIIK